MRTPELCSVSHTPRRPNHSTARSRDWTPRKSSPNGSEASTAKRNCPAWRRSSSPIAFSIVRMATDGSARLTAQWSVNRCRSSRLVSIARAHQLPEAPPPLNPPPPPLNPPPPKPPPPKPPPPDHPPPGHPPLVQPPRRLPIPL